MIPRILVLLAAYNGASRIDEQLRSILSQSKVALHIIVRDDASIDSTVGIVTALAESDKRVTLIANETPSGSAAQNFFCLIRGHDASGFDFVALSDQDDVWNSDKLERAAQMLAATCGVGYSSSVTAVWPDGATSLLRQCKRVTQSDFLFEGAGQGCTFVMTAQFYTRARQFLLQHKPLTCNLHYHDWALYALARTWKLTWAFDPRPTMRYTQHGENDTGARSSFDGVLRRLSKIKSGWYRMQLQGIAQLCLVAAAEPTATLAHWHELIQQPPRLDRRIARFRFCIAGGRRRFTDKVILLIAVLLGWI